MRNVDANCRGIKEVPDGDSGGKEVRFRWIAAEPPLDDECVDRKSNPEGEAEELVRGEMGEPGGGEEYAHDWARGGDSQQYDDGAQHPAAGAEQMVRRRRTLTVEKPCADEAEEEQGVEEQNGGSLDPAADGEGAHGVGGQAYDKAKRKEQAFGPGRHNGFAKDEEWRDQNEGQRGENVRKRESGMGSERFVEAGHGGWRGFWGIGQRNDPPDHDCHGDDDA